MMEVSFKFLKKLFVLEIFIQNFGQTQYPGDEVGNWWCNKKVFCPLSKKARLKEN